MRDALVTIFGGSGFLGRSLVEGVAKKGAQIRIICRDPHRVGYLKTFGEPGQISFARLSSAAPEELEAACNRSTHVVNLIGILYENRAGDFVRIQGELPKKIAMAAASAGAEAMVHVSSIGASRESKSDYARSKAQGEEGVAQAFAGAAILRPSIIFGPGDGFFERFGDMATRSPFLPLVDGGKTRFQPVYVGDVTAAIIKSLQGESGVFELGGPQIYTFKELLAYLLATLKRHRILLPVSSKLLQLPAMIMEKFPNPQITRDQLRSLAYDNIVAEDAQGLSDLGIAATPLETIVPAYVKAYAAS